jgi:transcriptional regulator with XRE-family HTH domain
MKVPNRSLRRLGETISYERRIRSLSQWQLAARAGLSEDGLKGVEQGRRRDPRISTVLKIADALGMSIDELLAEPEPLDF